MKKIASVFIALALTVSLSSAVYAGCHGGRGNTTTVIKSYVCSVVNCEETVRHTHNGKTYSAHYYGDGHKYHGYCDIEECYIEGYHEHDGAYCFAHTVNDGHDYHGYCGVSGCTLDGYHEHDGSYCFAHTANDGHNHRSAGRHHR